MPRYMVERTFPDGLAIPTNLQGRETTAKVAAKNAELGVTWVHSYVTEDLKKTYCVYDAPSPEAIREVARGNNLPVDRILPVRVLDRQNLPLDELPERGTNLEELVGDVQERHRFLRSKATHR